MRFLKLMMAMVCFFVSVPAFAGSSNTSELELWFFHSKQCPWCHEMAPEVIHFATAARIKTVGLPERGDAIIGFDEVRHDDEAYRAHRVIYLPTLILVNTKTGQHQLITKGMLVGDELIDALTLAQEGLTHA